MTIRSPPISSIINQSLKTSTSLNKRNLSAIGRASIVPSPRSIPSSSRSTLLSGPSNKNSTTKSIAHSHLDRSRSFCSKSKLFNESPSPSSSSNIPSLRKENSTETSKDQKETIDDGNGRDGEEISKERMRIQFTCTAQSSLNSEIEIGKGQVCGHRNLHEFSKHSFYHGIVLVQCPSCLNRHLIADHLQWFTSNPTSDDPNFRDGNKDIIDIMKLKGEIVKRGRIVTSRFRTKNDDDKKVQNQNDEVIEFY